MQPPGRKSIPQLSTIKYTWNTVRTFWRQIKEIITGVNYKIAGLRKSTPSSMQSNQQGAGITGPLTFLFCFLITPSNWLQEQ